MSKADQAVACFNEGFCCSQAVLATYCEPFGLDRDTGLRLSGSFCGGMGGLGEVCGAVAGAFMVLGLEYARADADDRRAKEEVSAKVRQFAERFKARNSSIICRDLLGCDLTTPEGRRYMKDNNLRATVCEKMVRIAAEILEELT